MKKANGHNVKMTFAGLLLKWNKEQNTRQMPWKGEKDPYKIWLSEIILQQTRVEQGLRYYNGFIKTFPDIHKLASAPDDKILKLWEGLGYYTRCRNLIITARYISKEKKGKFPDTYQEIKSLKGIGPYTAAAIGSFAFNLPHAVVDGNVFRVLARIFGIHKPIDSIQGKLFFTALANELLDKKQAGLYNQAIMDFGALICKPVPLCLKCIFKNDCVAFQHNKINELPVKKKRINQKKRWFYYLVIENKNEIAIRQRAQKDIWQQLYEFPMIESAKESEVKIVLKQAEAKRWLQKKNYEVIAISTMLRQKLSHQLITAQFIKIRINQKTELNNDWVWMSRKKVSRYAFPGIINQYLNEKISVQSLF